MSGRCLETKVQDDKNVVHLLIYTSVPSVISAEPFLTPHRTVIPRHTGKHWPGENQLWISRWWTHQIVQLPHLVLVETVGDIESHVIIQQNTNLQPVVGWSTPHPHTHKKDFVWLVLFKMRQWAWLWTRFVTEMTSMPALLLGLHPCVTTLVVIWMQSTYSSWNRGGYLY